MPKHNFTKPAVLAHLQKGHTGTPKQIGEALGLTREAVYAALLDLAGAGLVMKIGKGEKIDRGGNPPDIWAIYEAPEGYGNLDLVGRALAARWPIERAWSGARA